jgi:hypothetical protein
LVDRKVASGRERHNVFDGCLHLGQQPCVNMWIVDLKAHD